MKNEYKLLDNIKCRYSLLAFICLLDIYPTQILDL